MYFFMEAQNLRNDSQQAHLAEHLLPGLKVPGKVNYLIFRSAFKRQIEDGFERNLLALLKSVIFFPQDIAFSPRYP